MGKLDPAAIAQVREEAWPDVRDPDELHDVLHTLIALPEKVPAHLDAGGATAEVNSAPLGLTSASDADNDGRAWLNLIADGDYPNVDRSVSEWRSYFERLLQQGRASRAEHAGMSYWLAAERATAENHLARLRDTAA